MVAITVVIMCSIMILLGIAARMDMKKNRLRAYDIMLTIFVLLLILAVFLLNFVKL